MRTTFVAGVALGVFAIVATLWARLPADEIAHPLREPAADAVSVG